MGTHRNILTGLAALGIAAAACAANAAEFTINEKTNQDVARKLDIPVFFAVPTSARLALPKTINTTDKLIDFRHPGDPKGDIGLRLIATSRSGFQRRMAQSGLIKTGDVILSFRPEWGGAGSYPNIQMGVSHTGIAYIKDNQAFHIDNPMDVETLGANLRGDFTSEHYRTLKFLHIVRPRNLTDAQKTNIQGWAGKLSSGARRIYPNQIAFNKDYNAPKYVPGKPLEFVSYMAKAAHNQTASGTRTDMYCSEYVWSVLALRNCNPGSTDLFSGRSVPSCVTPALTPMKATGNVIRRRSRSAQAGLADGPLLVIESMKLAKAERDSLLGQVFVENPTKNANMSVGHREVAKTMQPKFAPLEEYYKDVSAGGWHRIEAYFVGNAFRNAMPDNYSPTSYLIDTLLPPDNSNRTMDYVATIMFE